jgi:hypothetical protein
MHRKSKVSVITLDSFIGIKSGIETSTSRREKLEGLELIESISAYSPLKQHLFRVPRFNKAGVRVEFENDIVILCKFTDRK